jgi:DNA-binding GntR family transcriptional regulator
VPLTTQAYDALKAAVLGGSLAPAEEVSEARLAQILGISRTPVRDAVRRLESEGFLVRDGESLAVPSVSAAECRDLYEVRARLECLAARQAAEKATPDDIANLRRAAAEVVRQYRGLHEPSELLAAGGDFHLAIAAISRNGTNFEFIKNLMGHVARYRGVGAREGREMYVEAHDRLIKAIAASDPEAAEAAMESHIRSGLDLVLARFGS